MKNACIWIIGTVGTAATGVFLASISGAGDSKTVQANIDLIAATLKKGDKEAAKKQAETIGKKVDELHEVMELFKPRKKDGKGGIGVGEKPGSVAQDGIEQMLLNLNNNVPAAGTLKKNAAALEQLGYRTAAIALVSHDMPVPKAATGAARKEWNDWNIDTVEASLKLAAAAKALDGKELQAAAKKINQACTACHTKHR